MNKTNISLFKTLLLVFVLIVVIFLFPGVTNALICESDYIKDGQLCSSSVGFSWCGNNTETCQLEPTVSPGVNSAVGSELGCDLCQAVCPSPEVACVGQNISSPTNPSATCQVSQATPNGGANFSDGDAELDDGKMEACGEIICRTDYITCSGDCRAPATGSCPLGSLLDPCTGDCSATPYILASPSVTQSAFIDITGALTVRNGDVNLSSGKSISLNSTSDTVLNMGNWLSGNFELNVFGDLKANNVDANEYYINSAKILSAPDWYSLALGGNVLEKNNGGEYNLGVGYYSLMENTLGNGNTAIGSYSLSKNTEGEYNTSQGYYSLPVNSTGNYNIAFGFRAGQNLETGSHNIIIGNNTNVSDPAGSYQMIIGDIIFGTNIGNNDGKVGIGTDDPSERLDVRDNLVVSGHVLSDAYYGTTGISVVDPIGSETGDAQNIWLGDDNDDLQVRGQICFGSDNTDCSNSWSGLIGGDTLWNNNGPGGPAEIYYNGGNVGIGTNNPEAELDIDGSMYVDDIMIKNDVQDVLMLNVGGNVGLEGQTSGEEFHLGLLTQDGDRGEEVGLSIFGFGSPSSQMDNTEQLNMGWNANHQEFVISSNANGTGQFQPIHIYTEGYENSKQLYLSPNGNVGIGTGNPSERLEINTNSSNVSRMRITDVDANQNPELQLQYASDAHWSIYNNKADTNSFNIWGPSAGNAMTIAANGNINIAGEIAIRGGSPEEGKVLTSNATGDATWENPVLGNGLWSEGITPGEIYYSEVGGNVGIGIDDPQVIMHINQPASSGAATLYTNSNTGVTATDGLWVGYSNAPYMWNYENTDLTFATNNLSRVTIDNGGSVGIGTAVIIMYAGFKWLTSRGNSSVISDAKEKIWAALIGLTIAFLSFIILNIVNPKLLTINLPTLEGIKTTNNSGSHGGSIVGEGGGTGVGGIAPKTTGSNAESVPCPANSMGGMGIDYSRAYTASYEGFSANRYFDVDGDSIGYGHHYPYTGDEDAPQSITQEEALQLLETDYSAAHNATRSTFSSNWNSIDTARQAALIDMSYNMGPGVFRKFPKMTTAIKNGDFETGANEMLDSDYAEQLPQRASNNAELLRNNNGDLYTEQADTACQ